MLATRGAPQESILGPLLWNVLFDGLLRMLFCSGVDVLAYADDITLLVRPKIFKEIEKAVQVATEQVSSWTEDVSL